MSLPRRVLMTADAVGGVWTYALDLAAALAQQGVGTVLAVMGPAPSGPQAAAAAQIPGLVVHHLPLALDWLAETPAEIRAAAQAVAELAGREGGIDLVHLNSPALAALAGMPAPVVAVSHSCLATWWAAMRDGPMPEGFAWRAALHGRGLAAAAEMVAPSAAFARATQAAYGLPATPVAVHNGRRPMDVPAQSMADIAFTAGRLWDEGKDVATLDRAASRIDVPVVAAGPTEGPNGARIALRHAEPIGPLIPSELALWLGRQPVFVSMARYEPFGLAVLEAAQAGCALVLADTPVFRELWDGAALFVPPGDDRLLAGGLHTLVPDRERRRALGAAAAGRARGFTAAAMARGTIAAYRRALAAGRGLAA